ncbi:transferrin-binding protein-like solute binding protein [Sphingomonas sp. C3-2]|uniref:transferrin-binding protein-like solute binding protein n=1 Tax=Sphingomonas sp. C3-2 TaxID=3062169 RepID=UPI00294B3746|nr:transferrin-binding protein-like solute binding protein [Sphingomonas sp. C3-2]WOK35890.1 transferrin-binding protein-like solute binding protein [Sphingomonas sp. C3-2]
MLEVRNICAIAPFALVAACGGGSGGGGGVAVIPTPPSAQANTTLTDIQYSDTFGGSAAETNYRVSRATGGASLRGQATTISTDGGAVRYDAASRSYTLSGTPSMYSARFGPAHKDDDQSSNVLTVYQKGEGGQQETMVLFNPGDANTELALTYTSYGAFQKINGGVDSVDVDTAFFSYGIRTTAAQMPRTGQASYTTRIDGQFGDATGVYALGGDSQFTANFSAATFAFSMTPIGQHVQSGARKYFGRQDINGTIKSSIDGGQLFFGDHRTGTGYDSSVDGYFYGPGAAEIGGVFTLTGKDGFGVGAVVGKKN